MHPSRSIRAAAVAGKGLLTVTLLATPACRTQNGPEAPTVRQVERNPDQYYGQTVTLVGEADDVYGQQVFELEGTGWGFASEVLVLGASPIQLDGETITDDDQLVVEGELRQLVVADIERELSIDLDPQLEVEFENEPVLVATSIRRVGETQASWRADQAQQGQQAGQQAGQQGQQGQEMVAFTVYVVSPVDFVGATVEGDARVAEVISDRAFWLTDDQGRRTLAIVREDVPAHEMIDIDAGQRIRFSGLALTSGAMDDLTGTLEEDAKDALRSEPAFIAMYWDDVEIVDRDTTVSERSY